MNGHMEGCMDGYIEGCMNDYMGDLLEGAIADSMQHSRAMTGWICAVGIDMRESG